MINDIRNTQMAALVLSKHASFGGDKGLEPLKLTQLLYMAERRSLRRYGELISDDTLISLPEGPALEHTYTMLQRVASGDTTSPWGGLIQGRDGYVSLARSLRTRPHGSDLDELSPADIDILKAIYRKFGHMSEAALSEYLRSSCAEWQPHASARCERIDLMDVFLALGFSPEESEAQVEASQEHRELREACAEALC